MPKIIKVKYNRGTNFSPEVIPKSVKQYKAKKKALINTIKRVVKTDLEKKYFDAYATPWVNLNSTGAVVSLSNVLQGDTDLTRTGAEIRAQRLELFMSISTNNTILTSVTNRIIVFIDKQNEGVLPTVSDILASSNTHSHYNIENRNRGRYKILKDLYFELQVGPVATYTNLAPSNATAQLAISRCFKFNFNLKNMKIQYYEAGGSATLDARKNQIFLLGITDNATDSGALWDSRLFFTDA